MRTGEVAQQGGVNRETLRYYERRGLIAAPRRSSGGHRVYASDVVTTLRIIKAAQRLGFTLDEIANLVDVGTHRHGRRLDAQLPTRAAAKIAEIDGRIEDLQTIRANLIEALNAGCDDLATCASTDDCPIPFADIAPLGATEKPPQG